jgi:hypothetical protein
MRRRIDIVYTGRGSHQASAWFWSDQGVYLPDGAQMDYAPSKPFWKYSQVVFLSNYDGFDVQSLIPPRAQEPFEFPVVPHHVLRGFVARVVNLYSFKLADIHEDVRWHFATRICDLFLQTENGTLSVPK